MTPKQQAQSALRRIVQQAVGDDEIINESVYDVCIEGRDLTALLAQIEPPAEDVLETVERINARYKDLYDSEFFTLCADIDIIIHAATKSAYRDYTWEDVAMLVQENRVLKQAATKPCGCEGLVDALERIISGDCMKFKDSRHYKTSQCVHGKYSHEGCENCISEFCQEALAQYNAGKKEMGE